MYKRQEYLRRRGRLQAEHNARDSLWRTYDVQVAPLGTDAARDLVERLFAANQGSGRTASGAADAPGTGRR